MDLAAFAIQDKFEEALDNAPAPLSCEEQWSNRIELLNKLSMRELLPMDASYSTTNNIDLHPLQDGDVQYPFGVSRGSSWPHVVLALDVSFASRALR